MVARPSIAQSVALVLAIAPAFLGGASLSWMIAILLAMAGLSLLCFPPVVGISRPFAGAATAAIGACALAFLPACWFGWPSWRKTFQGLDLELGALVTPQPWITLEGLGMVALGLVWALFLLCQPVCERMHRRLAAGYTLGVAAFAAFAMWAANTGWHHPWGQAVETFGFLANRNQVGTFLFMGAVAGLGPFWQGIERRKWGYILSLGLGIAVIAAAALAYNESRGGVIFLFVGLFTWMIGISWRRVDRRLAVSAVVLTLFGVGVFVTSQAPAWKRLAGATSREGGGHDGPVAITPTRRGTPKPDAPYDFRVLEYRDTLRMIGENPVAGVGLGNFQYIFPQYRRASLSEEFCIHPDSSWLLFASEAGMPAAAAMAVLILLAFLRLRGRSDDASWPLRWASATAVLVFVVHCNVDVPGHRIATLLPALFLAGLAFRRPSAEVEQDRGSVGVARGFFVVSGVVALLAAVWLAGLLPKRFGAPATNQAEKARVSIFALYQKGETKEAIATARAALAQTPLASGLYFQRGTLELNFVGAEQTVDRLYATERILEPLLTNTPFQQAAVWFPVDPNRALPLFAEAMARARRQPFLEKGVRETFSAILRIAEASPGTVDRLLPLAGNVPDLVLDWARVASGAALNQSLCAMSGKDPNFAGWSKTQRRELVHIWYSRGDRATLMSFLRDQPRWEEAGWPVIAGDLARQNRYEEAWRLAAGKCGMDRPPEPPLRDTFDVARLTTLFSEQRTQVAAERLVHALFEKEDYGEVIRRVEQARAASISSPQLCWLASVAASRLNRWPVAWSELQSAIQRTDPSAASEY